jgi:hypothetical protein
MKLLAPPEDSVTILHAFTAIKVSEQKPMRMQPSTPPNYLVLRDGFSGPSVAMFPLEDKISVGTPSYNSLLFMLNNALFVNLDAAFADSYYQVYLDICLSYGFLERAEAQRLIHVLVPVDTFSEKMHDEIDKSMAETVSGRLRGFLERL